MLPALVTSLREGYGPARLGADAAAGLTVAVVALPLSMAIAIAGGATPDRGLVTAIVGGFVVSALGGSRHQIGGPAGAFIGLVAVTIERHGVDGLLVATCMAGLLLVAAGLVRLGGVVRLVPHPVLVGFTTGIALVIFASQIRDLLGLSLVGREPASLLPKLAALGAALGTVNPAAAGLGAACVAAVVLLRRLRPGWPAFLIVAAAASLVAAPGLPVETIGSRFGPMPAGLPMPSLPEMSASRLVELLPAALAIALLGGVESLLSAVVADGMSGGAHRSNVELVAQGAANVACGLFGGVPATGTIARTATNIRAGGTSPVAGMLHAAFLLAILLLAAPLMAHVPLAALAAILALVSWGMVDRAAIAGVLRGPRADALMLLVTFGTVVLRGLVEGLVAGLALGALLFMLRRGRAA